MIAADVTALPPGDSPDLILVPATPAEHIKCLKLNSVAWKGPLDIDTYIAREHHLASQRLTRGGLTCWILVQKDEPENERTILSSCESYRKKALLAYDGAVEQLVSYGGYAKRMMEELSVRLESWKVEGEKRQRVLFTVLYSDIGKKFYAQFGWKPFPAAHMTLKPVAREAGNGVGAQTRALKARDVEKFMCNEAVFVKLGGRIMALGEEEFFAERLLPSHEPPVVKGAGNDQARVYATWTRTFGGTPKENVLYILRWVYDDPSSAEEEEALVEAMVGILRQAQFEAHAWNMAKIEFWNPEPLEEKAVKILEPGAEVVHREKDSIPCLRWTGAEQGFGEDVEWILNEKYTWC
ncbi:hypothetical protein N7468_001354 [Penicillium chermesinum]|uniref:LYC1 C-terminal domain-containing protein n=1 Tax=Penicillium chermesinum TaxID=63820 RepID=A0A9W9PI72_9EURO|nr:uncharacterized protein N7468_001354 [Penicillium chermesinum]KAJ5246371.1 hypothetical protein N7468_001354 [Penicillium chermesinum]KAJ6144652.1 hypothetical protein N7470_008547 [Penicillium chermesinum]